VLLISLKAESLFSSHSLTNISIIDIEGNAMRRPIKPKKFWNIKRDKIRIAG
jgi:hypothetical protein